jgi:hypothetical protein
VTTGRCQHPVALGRCVVPLAFTSPFIVLSPTIPRPCNLRADSLHTTRGVCGGGKLTGLPVLGTEVQ